ncbi:tetratricopeptide repeat protein [Lysobacter sp. K5869]|uniref:tetratricopeptide repeat protein n=1 Tax=Lysobacter sp. K5869 TaxID=2820808 RepID=UPI001C05EFDF|nr:tetratricopeptide repeat protein [Lysobacter sp. K5869]QWP78647.1 tetratricopeptide repeat protein [Lysobacter sp. K5869]
MSASQTRILFYIAALATLVLYWSGLKGPFIFDDAYNLDPLKRWIDGQASAAEIIFGNQSGPLGRPVSMASFWLSAATGGMHPFPFKFGNLLIHLVCGALAWQVVRRILALDERLRSHANTIGAIVACLWLLHPINVSTVLYAVQRMAQLSTLFALAAVWAYLSGRAKLEAGQSRPAAIRLFVGFPLLLALAAFSKENGIVVPALCLVIEIAYFRSPRPSIVKGFYALFLAVPALAAIALALRYPDQFFNGYEARGFTLTERLLSQPRALMEYIGLILWPRGGQMGLFVDDFQTSHGLLSPASTLFALLALIGMSVAAALLRRRAPTLFAGWFFFLVAHSVESGILPLELYFEHRNYLPSIGLLLAVVGIAELLPADGFARAPRMKKLVALAPAVAALAFAFVTWSQVRVWRTEEGMIDQALVNRPDSARANIMKAGQLLNTGKLDQARILTQRVTRLPEQSHRLQGYVSTEIIDCWSAGGAKANELDRGVSNFQPPIQLSDALSFRQLLDVIETKRCGGLLTESRIAQAAERVLDSAPSQAETSKAKWMLRTMAATAHIRAEQWEQAQTQAEKAWNPGADPAVGGLLARIYIHNGRKEEATRALDQVAKRLKGYETIGQEEVASLRAQIAGMPDPAGR